MPSPSRVIRIATRGSALALAQAHTVLAQCEQAFPDLAFEIAIIKTTGDKQLTASLAHSDLPKGLFTKEIETALLQEEADLAVHSLKDLPTDLPTGLILGAVSQRADVRDVLIWRDSPHPQSAQNNSAPRQSFPLTAVSLADQVVLPTRSIVATSSTRRAAQLSEKRPDLQVVPIRGNVGTRLKKLAEQPELRATLLAAAGLERLRYHIGSDGILRGPDAPDGLRAAPLPLEEMLPCVGQAALGIEIRAEDAATAALCSKLDHFDTRQCVSAERAFLSALGGGCHLAVAAYAQIQDGRLSMQAVSFLQGKAMRSGGCDTMENAEALGHQLAHRVMS